jgi:hypothetical protein
MVLPVGKMLPLRLIAAIAANDLGVNGALISWTEQGLT